MRVKDGRVISNFITQALKSEALTISEMENKLDHFAILMI